MIYKANSVIEQLKVIQSKQYDISELNGIWSKIRNLPYDEFSKVRDHVLESTYPSNIKTIVEVEDKIRRRGGSTDL